MSGPCSRGCRAAWADAPSGGVRVSPVYLRSGRCWCCRVRVGNARSPVWGWCGFRACRRWGVGDDGMPRDCACWVRLRGFLVFVWRVCFRAFRMSGAVVDAPLRGVFLRVLLARLLGDYCLSAVSCPVACCLFVTVCVACRLLCGVRFVSAPAPTVAWFTPVCVGVRLTATLVVVYCLLCKGCFWQFAARFCALGCSR